MTDRRESNPDTPKPSFAGGDAQLLAALRRGDESAFAWLLDTYHTSLVRLARLYVSSAAVAEEVVQEAWLGVLTGLSSFEGRSSFKTWLYRILINRAKTRGEREGRSIPFSALGDEEPAVEPSRFDQRGHWTAPVPPNDTPEKVLLSSETTSALMRAIDELPSNYRAVVLLRDIEECSSEEACNILGVSESNQRVLLHRARARLRAALEKHLSQT